MNPRRLATLSVLFVLAFVGLSIGFSSGPPPGLTGAPGTPTEPTCLVCHASYGGLNLGPATYSVNGPAHLAGATSALLDIGWSLPVGVGQRRGFQITVRNSAGFPDGGWTVVQATTTQKNGPNHMNHKLAGVGQQSWQCQWNVPVVPVLPAGPVTFYAAGNYSDGNGAPTGDYIHTASFTTYQAGLTAANAAWPVGTIQALNLSAPTVPSHIYILAVSDSIAVATPLGGPMVVPLDILSPLTTFAWQTPAIFANFIGTLDPVGQAQAQVNIPYVPQLAGYTLHFAYATLDPTLAVISEVSNRVTRVLL